MNTFVINKKDNVCVLLEPKDGIPAGHKLALCDIKAGGQVIKYGFPIGSAKTDIRAGEHVHTHNVRSNLGDTLEYEYTPVPCTLSPLPTRSFMGYRRKDGKVGIRNEVWIIPTVGCVNAIARKLENEARALDCSGIDGVHAYCHPYGCSQLGKDFEATLSYLASLIRHPNAGAVLVVGLGCENGNITELKRVLGEYDPCRVMFLNCQDVENEIDAGSKMLAQLLSFARGFRREACPSSELVIGLKCGGSDGFSGITANPLLGLLSDRICAEGGSTLLTEVPEMFGAETILMNRCENRELFDKTVELINDFKRYFMSYGERVDENPSPGNREGGITTLEDKSLGCVQKGGSAPIRDVLKYGERVRVHGLSLLESPGNDLVASNALAAAGAQLILFTTGRGTPFGCPVPTVKISSNTTLYNKKRAWIDFDAGTLITGNTADALTEEFYDFILSVASGETLAKSEKLCKADLAIFKNGVTL